MIRVNTSRIASYVFICLLFVFSLLGFTSNIQTVKASGPIYIRADGSLDPPSAPIDTVDNVTYTFTGDINDSVVVERDNIVIEGAGHVIKGTEYTRGLDLSNRTNVRVKDLRITNFRYGIWLHLSTDCLISGNNITANNGYGVYLNSSSNNRISGNNITANNWGGVRLTDSSSNTILGSNITDSHGDGICLDFSSNNTILGNNITDNQDGVSLYGSSNNSVSGNDITSNFFFGISFSSSHDNTASGNNITDNRGGIDLSSSFNNSVYENIFVNNGLFVSYSYGSVIADNLVNGKPLVYLENVSDVVIEDAGQVVLVNCNRITVENLNLTYTTTGVELWMTDNSTIAGNNIKNNNQDAIYLFYSSSNRIFGNNIKNNQGGTWLDISSNNNTILGNNITDNGYGVQLSRGSSNNSISGNKITANNDFGIYLYTSFNNSISGNNITAKNDDGIRLSSSNYNSISGNNITANNWYGIMLVPSSCYNSISGNNIANNHYGIAIWEMSNYNSIFHNNFVNNWLQVSTYRSFSVWDDGYPSGGNYWSNYNGTDINHDGIGDTPYRLDARNEDDYPLMGLFSSFNTSLRKPVNVISNSTIEGFEYFQVNSTIKMHVSNMTSDQTYGFCRISIPKDLISPPYDIIINKGSVEPLFFNGSIYDNGTHRWIYFAYEHSTLEIVIIPEFPSLLILSLFMIVTLLIVTTCGRRSKISGSAIDSSEESITSTRCSKHQNNWNRNFSFS